MSSPQDDEPPYLFMEVPPVEKRTSGSDRKEQDPPLVVIALVRLLAVYWLSECLYAVMMPTLFMGSFPWSFSFIAVFKAVTAFLMFFFAEFCARILCTRSFLSPVPPQHK